MANHVNLISIALHQIQAKIYCGDRNMSYTCTYKLFVEWAKIGEKSGIGDVYLSVPKSNQWKVFES